MADAKEKALSLLNKRDKTAHELRVALEKTGFSEEETENALEYLEEMGYIDDISYAERYTEISIDKMRGPLRIRRELQTKGINDDIIEDVLYDKYGSGSELEREIAKSLIEKIKYRNPSLSEEKLLIKIVNKLRYEGFSDYVINQLNEEICNE